MAQEPDRRAAGKFEVDVVLTSLTGDAERLSPAELVRRLNERSGLLAMLRAQCKDEATFARRRSNLACALRGVLPNAAAHTPYGMTEALPVTEEAVTMYRDLAAAALLAGATTGG